MPAMREIGWAFAIGIEGQAIIVLYPRRARSALGVDNNNNNNTHTCKAP